MKLLIPLVSLLIWSTSFAQNDSLDTLSRHRRIAVLPVPAFGYSPETKTYFGAVCLFNFNFYNDTLTRSSNAKIEFNYSWNKQLILESEWNYFFKAEKWFMQGLMHFSKYPDRYYGIGANTNDSSELLFQSQRIKLHGSLLKQIAPKLFIGLGLKYQNYSNLSYFDNLNSFSELKAQQTVGIRFIALQDKRNNLLTPTKGNYLELSTAINKSETVYSHVFLDARKYFSFSKSFQPVIAFRLYHLSTLGNAPFYDGAIFGGDRQIRGYFYGRFRDQHSSILQAEYRMKIVWRFGLAVFGGAGLIYNSSISLENFKPNTGIGLRFLVDKKENTFLRFDYAIGKQNQNGFYVSFGEAF